MRLIYAGITAIAVLVPQAAVAENTLTVGSRGDALTLDPYAQAEGPTFSLLSQIYESLTVFDQTLELAAGLATNWEAVDDSRWRFRLRENVRFQDGTPFTAEDVVFSLRRAQDPTSDYNFYVRDIAEINIIDPLTVEFVTSSPLPLLPRNLTNVLIMSEAWAIANDAVAVQDFAAGGENYAVRHAMGTGPFSLISREQDVRTVLGRNDDWWGLREANPHNLDQLIYLPISNDATRVAALLSGQVDFVPEPPLQDLARIERTPGLTTMETPQVRTIFFGLNVSSPELRTGNVEGANPLSDLRVRQAFYHAIDADAIQSRIMRGRSDPTGFMVAPGINGYFEDLDVRLAYDPSRAQSLLAEAGYADGFSLRLDCPNDRYLNDEAICQAVVAMLARIGVDVHLDALPKTLHFPKLENRETDFYMLGWSSGVLDSQDTFDYMYEAGSVWNIPGYDNPQINELLNEFSAEFDSDRRLMLIRQAWEIVMADLIYLPLHNQVVVWALRDNIEMPITANNNFQGRWVHLTE